MDSYQQWPWRRSNPSRSGYRSMNWSISIIEFGKLLLTCALCYGKFTILYTAYISLTLRHSFAFLEILQHFRMIIYVFVYILIATHGRNTKVSKTKLSLADFMKDIFSIAQTICTVASRNRRRKGNELSSNEKPNELIYQPNTQKHHFILHAIVFPAKHNTFCTTDYYQLPVYGHP